MPAFRRLGSGGAVIPGSKGDKGDKGDTGSKGDKGDKGDPGASTVGGGGSPVGVMSLWKTAATVPSGFLACDGARVSKNAYPALFALLGDTYGASDSTTFVLPDSPITGDSSFIISTGL